MNLADAQRLVRGTATPEELREAMAAAHAAVKRLAVEYQRARGTYERAAVDGSAGDWRHVWRTCADRLGEGKGKGQ